MWDGTRPAAVAGQFYAGDPRTLADVDHLLALRCRREAPAPKMLVVPHAGYVYSGPVAAQAYALLAPWREQIRRVVLLGPTHRVAIRGPALTDASAFDTPLGRVELDPEAPSQLRGLSQVQVNAEAHAREHSLEVQLPFLQRTLGTFTLVPLAVGEASAAQVAQVLERLWGGDETLVVISTDLSHYLSYAQARTRDRATVERILQLDPALDHAQACGATPLGGALLAARAHGLVPRLLDLRNSGDTAGDRARVVGYCAMAFEARTDTPASSTMPAPKTTTLAGPRIDEPCPQRDRPGAGPAHCCRAGASGARQPGRHLRHPAPRRRIAWLRRHAVGRTGAGRRRAGARAGGRIPRPTFRAPGGRGIRRVGDRGLGCSSRPGHWPRAPKPRRTRRCGPASMACCSNGAVAAPPSCRRCGNSCPCRPSSWAR